MGSDPAILTKPSGLENLEATRLHAMAMKDSPEVNALPEGTQESFMRFMAGCYRSFCQEELEGRAKGLRKKVQSSLSDLNAYNPDPASGEEVIVINETPNKVALGASKLDQEYIRPESYQQVMAKMIEKALTIIKAPREAGTRQHGDPPTPSLSTTVEEDLRRMLRDSVRDRKIKSSYDFGLVCSIAMDKLHACIETAKAKGDYRTAYHLGKKAKDVDDRVKQFLLMADKLGFTEARGLYLAVNNPFSNMKQEHWDILTGVATEKGFKDALEKAFDGFPEPISQPAPKRRRAADSDAESEGSPPRSSKKAKKGVPYCKFCGKRGHREVNCFKKNNNKPKGKK